jgi:hypothetical protein
MQGLKPSRFLCKDWGARKVGRKFFFLFQVACLHSFHVGGEILKNIFGQQLLLLSTSVWPEFVCKNWRRCQKITFLYTYIWLFFSLSTHKQCILSWLYTTALLWLPKKPNIPLRDFFGCHLASSLHTWEQAWASQKRPFVLCREHHIHIRMMWVAPTPLFDLPLCIL